MVAVPEMALTHCYFGMDTSWLATRKSELQTAISAATTRGQSFSQPDISMVFPALVELRQELAEVNAAIDAAAGTDNSIVIARLN